MSLGQVFAEVNFIIKIFIYEELTFIVPRTMDELLHTTSLLILTISLKVYAALLSVPEEKRQCKLPNQLKSCSDETGADFHRSYCNLVAKQNVVSDSGFLHFSYISNSKVWQIILKFRELIVNQVWISQH